MIKPSHSREDVVKLLHEFAVCARIYSSDDDKPEKGRGYLKRHFEHCATALFERLAGAHPTEEELKLIANPKL